MKGTGTGTEEKSLFLSHFYEFGDGEEGVFFGDVGGGGEVRGTPDVCYAFVAREARGCEVEWGFPEVGTGGYGDGDVGEVGGYAGFYDGD